jgi:cystathionine beta-synthase
VAAVKGYKCIFTMTDKNSQEKVETLAALGATIIKTPGLPYDSPNSYISVAKRLHRETPNSFMLDQVRLPAVKHARLPDP